VIKIAVILLDGTLDAVSEEELNLLLEKRGVQAFLRSDGWVRVSYDTLRGSGNNRRHDGNERRSGLSTSKTHCNYCGKEFVVENGGSIYSVIVDNREFSIQIVEGELIHGAYHFCSDLCMFHREQGVACFEQLLAEGELAAEESETPQNLEEM